MNRHARRAITFTAAGTDRGRVEFDVDQVGVFTGGDGSNGYPHDCDTEQLEVVYRQLDRRHLLRPGTGAVGCPNRQRDPAGRRVRVAYIVARLVEAFLERGDVDELLAAHRAHHAPARIARHEDNLQRVEAELAEWQSRRATGAAGAGPATCLCPVGRSRDGEAFLISTVGTRRPA